MLLNLHNIHYESIFYEKDEEVTTLFQKNDPLVKRLSSVSSVAARSSIEQVDEVDEEKSLEEEVEDEVDEEPEEQVDEEDMENVKTKITEIVNDYFLFVNKKLNFEII